MIIILKSDVSSEQRTRLEETLRAEGLLVREIVGESETVLGAVGQVKRDLRFFEQLPGVAKVIPISRPYKLVSRQLHPKDSLVRVGGVEIGGDRIVLIAGPCAIESREQAMAIAERVCRAGAVLFRGGAFKPRTSPYAFQGLGEEGLKILAEVRERTGMGVVTEMVSPAHADLMVQYVDVIQIGARNMQNFELLRTVGRLNKPVLLKRGLSATIEEWLMSAEYILSEGNDQVVLCERGIRTFETYTRNTLDLSAIPVLKKLTHLPVIVDPSHATGIREKVLPMARAAVAAGADGLTVEVHTQPDQALSDGPQSLYPEQFEQLARDVYVIAPVVGKQLDFSYLQKSRQKTRSTSGARPDGRLLVAFAGEFRAFSHRAVNQFFGNDVDVGSAASFRDVFDRVCSGQADYGVVPLENSLTGSIHENYDLLLEKDARIVGEVTLRIQHALIGLAGTDLSRIEQVTSHPQALQQCRQFLDAHPAWERVAAPNTSTAVRKVKEAGDPHLVAIAAREAARLHGLQVLKEGIETNPRNFTRFVVIGMKPLPTAERKKSSIVFATGNQPGALFESLRIFAEAGINLVKLESRPIQGKPWEYMFYVDLMADTEDEALAPILAALAQKTDFLRLLGSY